MRSSAEPPFKTTCGNPLITEGANQLKRPVRGVFSKSIAMDANDNLWYNKLMFGKKKSGHTKALSQNKIQANIASTDNESALTRVNAQPDVQLQNKIILYFANNQNIDAVPDGKATVTDQQRKDVVAALQSGKITTDEISKFLQQVLMPLQDAKANASAILRQISKSLKQKQILAIATGHDASNWQNVNESDLKNLVAKPLKGQYDYRTPIGFAKFRESFLEGIIKQATPEQLHDYINAMDDLEQKLYGRRFDYYQQILLLSGKTLAVEQPVGEVVAIAEDLKMSDLPVEEKATPKPAPTILPPMTDPLSPAQSAELLNRTVIDGSPWRQDGNEYALNTNSLLNCGLVPSFEVNTGERLVFVSYPFQLSDGRGAVLGFVQDGENVKARSFYLNTKTGLWHFAPDIIRGARGEGMGQITEGFGLASTMLPIAIQRRLAELVKAHGFKEITSVNPDFIFAGTAIAYDTMQDYREAMSRGQMQSDFYKEVDSRPINSSWQPNGKVKNVPQLLSVNATMTPDFQKFVERFVTYSILAGQVLVEGFASNDDQFVWMFCNDERSRTWIGNIEVNSPLTSTGCHHNWMAGGDLTTPLYEYTNQAGNYGDPSDTRKGMIGMWNQYLSKIPLIQEFLAWRSQQEQK